MSPSPRIAFLVLAIALAIVAAGCGGGESGAEPATTAESTVATAANSVEVPVDAVALVDGDPVPKAEYDRAIAQAEQTFLNQGREFPPVGTVEYEALKSQAVQFLVQRVEFAQQASELGIEVTSQDVDGRLQQLKDERFDGDEEAYEEALAEQGLSDEQLKQELEALIIAERLFEEVTKDVTVSDEQVQAYADENSDRVPMAREVRHILVTEENRALELLAEIEAGADFEELAKKNSLDPGSKDQGGRLTIETGRTVAEFDEFSFSAETGELSEPIETEFGWHIIEILSDATPVLSVAEELALDEARNQAMTAWVDELPTVYDGKVFYAVGFTPVSLGGPDIVVPEDDGVGTADDQHGG